MQMAGGKDLSFVMPGLVPGIHVLLPLATKTWMAGTSPAMTNYDLRRKSREIRPSLFDAALR